MLHFQAPDIVVDDLLPASSAIPTDTGLRLHRAVYNRIVRDYNHGNPIPIKLSTTVDAPPGSGLGSSSALVVAMVEVFRSALDLPLGPYDVARLAYEIERVDLKLAGGKQDQYAAAFGGLNFIEFLQDERVIVNPLRVRDADFNELEASLVVCFTGKSRASDEIIHQQVSSMRSNNQRTLDALHQLKADAIEMKLALLRGDLQSMAAVLDRSWLAKKQTAASVSNANIERLYAVGRAHGAMAGKVSGAGGGGFMTFITDPENRFRLMSALEAEGGSPRPVFFTYRGVESWATKR
jgi:D-glycero-alpha-D-manno-heptose-7-phosphate kinase